MSSKLGLVLGEATRYERNGMHTQPSGQKPRGARLVPLRSLTRGARSSKQQQCVLPFTRIDEEADTASIMVSCMHAWVPHAEWACDSHRPELVGNEGEQGRRGCTLAPLDIGERSPMAHGSRRRSYERTVFLFYFVDLGTLVLDTSAHPPPLLVHSCKRFRNSASRRTWATGYGLQGGFESFHRILTGWQIGLYPWSTSWSRSRSRSRHMKEIQGYGTRHTNTGQSVPVRRLW